MLPEQANDELAGAVRDGSTPQVRLARSRINYPRKTLFSLFRFSCLVSCFARINTPALTEVMGTASETSRPRRDSSSHMLAVNIAELKARLSSYLQGVR